MRVRKNRRSTVGAAVMQTCVRESVGNDPIATPQQPRENSDICLVA
jgi:hypothetical protein